MRRFRECIRRSVCTYVWVSAICTKCKHNIIYLSHFFFLSFFIYFSRVVSLWRKCNLAPPAEPHVSTATTHDTHGHSHIAQHGGHIRLAPEGSSRERKKERKTPLSIWIPTEYTSSTKQPCFCPSSKTSISCAAFYCSLSHTHTRTVSQR